MPFVVGETVGPYRILAKLGRGGMATVYKAYHPALDRYVAIKALHPAFMEDPNFLRRFQREARVVAKLEHPNIVPIYDFSSHKGQPYLVMKFIEGQTLKTRLKSHPIGRTELLHIIRAVGRALAYAHEQGILHRDVKPSNVLLADDGRIYLADFGLARIAQAGESTMSSDMMLGTPQYISPEQAMGLKDLDEGTDIYSLGVMLYELVVGQVPFSADTPYSIIHDHIYTPLPLPRQIKADIPEDVERVLLKALAKERRERFSDVQTFVDAFVTAIQSEKAVLGPGEDLLESKEDKPISSKVAGQPRKAEGADSVEAGAPLATHPASPDVSGQAGSSDEMASLYNAETVLDGGVVAGPGSLEKEKDEEFFQTEAESIDLAEKKRVWQRLRWWQTAFLLLGGIVCCLLVIGLVFGDQKNQNGLLLQTPSGDSQSRNNALLQDAIERTQNYPEDPYAFLELAMLYWDNGKYAQANVSFRKAFDLAEGDVQVLVDMLDVMERRGIWAGIVVALLTYQGTYPEKFTEEFNLRLNEAAYFAAETPNYADVVPVQQLASVNPGLEYVAKARNRLYLGEIEDAQIMLNRMLGGGISDMPEAQLLQAEIALKTGDLLLARKVLAELDSKGDIPEWIRAYMALLWGELGEENQVTRDPLLEVPDDPWALLQMLDASLAGERSVEAEMLVAEIQEIAGDDAIIYFSTGDILVKYKRWDLAVPFYLHALELNPDPPKEWAERLHMAVYYGGMSEQGVKRLIHPDVRLGVELRLMVEARYEMYYGDLALAERLVQKMLNEPPDLPEEQLLDAELMIQKGELDLARKILERITTDRATAYWIQEAAKVLLAEIGL